VFAPDTLCQLVSQHGRVARLVVAAASGSVPRDVGASMYVWADGQSGTIGGGMLEYQAVEAARVLCAQKGAQKGDWIRRVLKMPLGPALGQCCGGAVTVLSEVFSKNEADEVKRLASKNPAICRPTEAGLSPRGSTTPHATLLAGVMSEPFSKPGQPLWIYGAGHVGRALVATLAPLGFDITWIDTDFGRYPEALASGVRPLVSADPATAVNYAPDHARHLIVTCSHALDLEICHALLSHGFLSAGLIGSATKWARFKKKLINLGHSQTEISGITCPIGMPELGKSPEAIAIGVAAELLKGDASEHAPVCNLKECAT